MDNREKNRRKEHPNLIFVKHKDSVECLGNEAGDLFRCACNHPGQTVWLGWFKCNGDCTK